MNDIEYYKVLVEVIEFISEGNHFVQYEKGNEIAGNYWPQIFDYLISKGAGTGSNGGDLFIEQGQKLSPIYASAQHQIDVLEKEEQDRLLDIKFKEENILYGKKGYKISVIAIILSSLSILLEIVRWILSLAQ